MAPCDPPPAAPEGSASTAGWGAAPHAELHAPRRAAAARGQRRRPGRARVLRRRGARQGRRRARAAQGDLHRTLRYPAPAGAPAAEGPEGARARRPALQVWASSACPRSPRRARACASNKVRPGRVGAHRGDSAPARGVEGVLTPRRRGSLTLTYQPWRVPDVGLQPTGFHGPEVRPAPSPCPPKEGGPRLGCATRKARNAADRRPREPAAPSRTLAMGLAARRPWARAA
jgi:hypothetical protein